MTCLGPLFSYLTLPNIKINYKLCILLCFFLGVGVAIVGFYCILSSLSFTLIPISVQFSCQFCMVQQFQDYSFGKSQRSDIWKYQSIFSTVYFNFLIWSIILYSFINYHQNIPMKIRVQKQEDYKQVENLTREAFWNLYCEGANEHLIVHNMRKSPDLISELSLVVEQNGEILGHILYSHSKVCYENGAELPVITFGPVSVLPSKQINGIGSFLITQSLKKAKELGFKAVVILGYPLFYHRFGFQNSKKFNIKAADGNYYVGMMVLQLLEGYLLKNAEGVFKQSQCFSPDPAELQQFDKLFPPKQKFRTKSQQAFQCVSSKLWNEPYELDVKDLRNNTQKLQN